MISFAAFDESISELDVLMIVFIDQALFIMRI